MLRGMHLLGVSDLATFCACVCKRAAQPLTGLKRLPARAETFPCWVCYQRVRLVTQSCFQRSAAVTSSFSACQRVPEGDVVQSPLAQLLPALLTAVPLLLARRTPGMAALGLRVDAAPGNGSRGEATQGSKRVPRPLLTFIALSAVLPEAFAQLRRRLIMSGCSMPDAARWKCTAWQALRGAERGAALARALNLVRLQATLC